MPFDSTKKFDCIDPLVLRFVEPGCCAGEKKGAAGGVRRLRVEGEVARHFIVADFIREADDVGSVFRPGRASGNLDGDVPETESSR